LMITAMMTGAAYLWIRERASFGQSVPDMRAQSAGSDRHRSTEDSGRVDRQLPSLTPAVSKSPRAAPYPRRARQTPSLFARGPVVAAGWQNDTIVRVARLRIPRAMLPMLGVPIIEPDGTGTIEIEAWLGDDGSARAVRVVRPRSPARN
jgi:hypothetical protein